MVVVVRKCSLMIELLLLMLMLVQVTLWSYGRR